MNAMMRAAAWFVVAVACLGCRPERKKKEEIVPRKECNKPSYACYERCVNRNASRTCGGCCWEQRYLCDTGQKASWEYCDQAE
jgi:hypothetical protein